MKKCRERYYNSTALYIIEKIFSNKKKYKNFFFILVLITSCTLPLTLKSVYAIS
ncbi:hypothetical protein RNJ44_03773 [Nakaseomyces bracarensis]|uniref:Uncharacterized protein n=1 Tax=Nakaseomyces bracarensis TaxID=273131 RepID=A0ABR4NXW2_9SACH